MRRIVFLILAAVSYFICELGYAQSSVRFEKHAIVLPQGQLFGAVINPTSTIVISQQSFVTARHDNIDIWATRLAKVSVDTGYIIRSRIMKQDLKDRPYPPCGQMQFIDTGKVVAICSGDNSIDLIDANNLTTVRSIPIEGPGPFGDFEIVENEDLLFVVCQRHGNEIWLDRYKLSSGTKIDSLLLSANGIGPFHLAVDSQRQLAFISMKPKGTRSDEDALGVCHYGFNRPCRHIRGIPPIAKMEMWNEHLVAVTSRFADSKRECILSFQSNTMESRYCAPKSGVHYAISVVSRKYLVGYTGMAKYTWNEKIVTKSSTISIWTEHGRNPIGQTDFPMTDPVFQNAITMVGSSETPAFIAYKIAGNVIEVYKIRTFND